MGQLIFNVYDFFKDDLMVKQADHKLPRNVQEWEESVLGVLYNTHPWLSSNQKMVFEVPNVDADDGTGMGSIVFDDKIAIPVIIHNFKLKPLDLYIHNGKIRTLTQTSFFKDTIGKELGQAQDMARSGGAVGAQPIFDKVYPPFTGMHSYASSPDNFRKLIQDSLSPEQLKFAWNNPVFSEVVRRNIAPMKVAAATETALAEEGVWSVLRLSNKFNNRTNMSYVHTPTEKIACVTGEGIIDPVMGIHERSVFGVEMNTPFPRYFTCDTDKEVAYESVALSDDFSIKTAACGNGNSEAYLIPLDGETILVGPFISMYHRGDGTEKIATLSGTIDIIERKTFDKPFAKMGNLFILGPDAVRVSLATKFTPLTIRETTVTKEAFFDGNTEHVILEPRPVGRLGTAVNYKGNTYHDFRNLFTTLEKEANLPESVRSEIIKKLAKRHKVCLKKDGSTDKAASMRKFANINIKQLIPVDKFSLVRAASFIQPVEVRDCERAIDMLPAARGIKLAAEKDKVKNTVDAVLNLGVVTPENVGKYIEKLDVLEEAAETCAHLLLLTRLGFPMEEQPIKTSLTALDSVINNLSTFKNTDDDAVENVT